ncbi:hypothetical protein BJX76DRAFT_144606 [Aspergillus varians]
MTHGFVRISRLGLIIFDEAHHCTRNHPANKVMTYFYHPTRAKSGPDAVPRILGLTASAGSSRDDLRIIEANLGSVCTTPQVHRDELLEHTHRPELRRVLYTPLMIDGTWHWGGTQKALIEAYQMLDIEKDPYVKKMRASSPYGTALQKVLESGKTYCSDQLKKFVQRVAHIFTELGAWAADYFIWASTEQLRGRSYDNSFLMDLENDERKYLVDILSQLPVPDMDIHSTDPADFPVSPKLQALISFLISADERNFSGLIFVQQRATVSVMAHLLSIHPSTRERFRTGGFIGMSNSTKKKDMLGDLLTVKMQRNTLDDFRDGRKNLIVATDVLEEGIDVSACSVVVCYDKPPNLKSFVQRRGRARRQHSTYAMVLSTEDDVSSLHKWQKVEKVMEEAYQEDRRHLEEVRALETIEEDVYARFYVESTGAVLTADNAMQHLFHFCSTLPRQTYVDNKPEFSFERHDGGHLRGRVTLPSCVIPTARRAEGKTWWKTERAARKEAAFQAYKALYEHGLVNDNLLPLTKSQDFTRNDLGSLPAIQDVSEQYDPWVDWAYSWSSPNVHQSRIIVRQNGDEAYMKLITPTKMVLLEPMTLFWDSDTTYTVEFEAAEPVPMTPENVESMRIVTAMYLQATSTRLLPDDKDFITLFGPDLNPVELAAWLNKNQGHESALEVFTSQKSLDLMGIVRDQSRFGELLLFRRWVDGSDALELECDPYPKRTNLLRQQTVATKRMAGDEMLGSPKKNCIISADQCTIDRLPATESVFGRFIAVILDRLEAALVATKLCETILRDIHFSDIRHVITAITMPKVQAPTHYQRYEFLGDSVLKFTVALSLYYQHPNWHEGYLTKALHAIVQNGRLARATLDCGLDSFIIGKTFTPRRWSAPLISEKLNTTQAQRSMSTKVLADIVEALIGAAYIDGGHAKAQACIRRFLPEVETARPDIPMPQNQDHQPHLIQHHSLEENIGYTFNNKALLMEALTHPSCQYDALTQSYQRLEFLGDAVLDMLIVDTMLSHPTEIPQGEMTRIKAALANANLLAFLCMEFSWTIPSSASPSVSVPTEETTKPKTQTLYTYLRHSLSFPLLQTTTNSDSESTALTRHATLRKTILTAIATSKTYPWAALSQLNANKFFSDIIESTLGAIYVDSGGNLATCKAFIQRLGIVSYLERMLDEGIDVVHPLQKAQMGLQSVAAQMGKDDEFRFGFRTLRVVGRDGDEKAKEMGNGNGNRTEEIVDGDGGEVDPGAAATYTCTIPVNGLGLGLEEVVVRGCLTKEDAEVRAASLVVELLSQRKVQLEMDDVEEGGVILDI